MLRLWGDRLYLSEGGGAFKQLKLGNTPEVQLLRQLLAGNGGGIRLGPMNLAGSGGCGYHWAPVDKTDESGHPNSSSAARKG
jgi:hypothetical protein